jgi:hypothetical protein
MAEPPTRPLSELVAEVIDRHAELSFGQTLRVLWALKLHTVIALLLLIVSAFTLGRYTFPVANEVERPSEQQLALSSEPGLGFPAPDEGLPDLSEAEFDKRSLEEFGAEIKRRQQSQDELKGLQRTLQQRKSVYVNEIGKRFEWSGVVSGFSVPYESNDGKMIAVGIKSGDYEANCLFDEHGHIGNLLSLDEGDPVTVTGVLNEDGDLVKCEFGLTMEMSVKIR